MTKEEIKAAVETAIQQHLLNNAAVTEATIPPGLEGIVSAAMAHALGAKLARIFDPEG
jgi:hypothetical protein